MQTIVIIEDDKDIAQLVAYNLRQEKFDTIVASSGIDGLKKSRLKQVSLIILDLMLPDISGLEICKKLKSDPKTRDLPVIILTAKGEEVDRIVGFEIGADDYMSKPFSPRELVLRVKAILNRIHDQKKEITIKPITFGLLYFDLAKPMVKVGKKEVTLTKTEMKLLELLLSMKGRVATREMLLDNVWGYDVAVTTRTVDTHIKRLRSKLGAAGRYVETVHGTGYRFKEKS